MALGFALTAALQTEGVLTVSVCVPAHVRAIIGCVHLLDTGTTVTTGRATVTPIIVIAHADGVAIAGGVQSVLLKVQVVHAKRTASLPNSLTIQSRHSPNHHR